MEISESALPDVFESWQVVDVTEIEPIGGVDLCLAWHCELADLDRWQKQLVGTSAKFWISNNQIDDSEKMYRHWYWLDDVSSLPGICNLIERNRLFLNRFGAFEEENKQLRNRYDILSGLLHRVNVELNPDRVVQGILDEIKRVIEAEGWSLLLLDEKKQKLRFEGAYGVVASKLQDVTINIGQGSSRLGCSAWTTSDDQ